MFFDEESLTPGHALFLQVNGQIQILAEATVVVVVGAIQVHVLVNIHVGQVLAEASLTDLAVELRVELALLELDPRLNLVDDDINVLLSEDVNLVPHKLEPMLQRD